jgi:hypothetical protein
MIIHNFRQLQELAKHAIYVEDTRAAKVDAFNAFRAVLFPFEEHTKATEAVNVKATLDAAYAAGPLVITGFRGGTKDAGSRD